MTENHLEEIADLEKFFRLNYLGISLEKPNRQGLIAIAKKGKKHWNAWKQKFPNAPVDFSGAEPDSLRDIDFSEFHFPTVLGGKSADFSNLKLSARNRFVGARFGDSAKFIGTTFSGPAIFNDAEFGDFTTFELSSFNGTAVFKDTVFGRGTSFRKSSFSGTADFSNAEFGSDLTLTNSKFLDSTNFNCTKFRDSTSFNAVYFRFTAEFSGATFGDETDFSDCQFHSDINFKSCSFGKNLDFSPEFIRGHAKFIGTETEFLIFGDNAKFGEFPFGQYANFSNVIFIGTVKFSSTRFSGNTIFEKIKFKGNAIFHGVKFSTVTFEDTVFYKAALFKGSGFEREALFHNIIFVEQANFSNPETKADDKQSFHETRFLGCWFGKGATFRNREFKSTMHFGSSLSGRNLKENEIESALGIRPKRRHGAKTIFLGTPDFHGCKFHQDTSFVGTEFEVPSGSDAARAFRTLKLAMEQLKSTHEEQKFFRLEMEADRPTLPGLRPWISWVYQITSDYGFSLWRPVAWLIGLSLMFGMAYGWLANTCAADIACAKIAWKTDVGSAADRTSAVIKYTLASVSPVPGLDKMQTELRAPLFGHHGWIPITALVLEILHKIAALVMAFLFALALRNLFKMKS